MQEFEPDFLVLLRVLEEGRVRFVLIGGLAMVALGSDYVTDDVNILYAREAKNLAALVAALEPLHPRLRGASEGLPFTFNVRALQNARNLQLITAYGSLDLHSEVHGSEAFEVLWERTATVELSGFSVHVASIDDLIAMKTTANCPKDQNHVMELRALRELTAEYHPSNR